MPSFVVHGIDPGLIGRMQGLSALSAAIAVIGHIINAYGALQSVRQCVPMPKLSILTLRFELAYCYQSIRFLRQEQWRQFRSRGVHGRGDQLVLWRIGTRSLAGMLYVHQRQYYAYFANLS